MDITPQDNTQPISDDQELAKALAGVLPEEQTQPQQVPDSGLQFEETAAPGLPIQPVAQVSPEPTEEIAVDPPVIESSIQDAPQEEIVIPEPAVQPVNELDGIKNDALNELRPLLNHVDLPAEEKFDTYLMLIRSTDDSSLIAPAHAVAQNITDEKRKAEALLDIIKEIDYLSRKDSQI
ncbi:MAG: hypothetical protein WAR37_02535 [Candidatus Microsaccharimonas sp.]